LNKGLVQKGDMDMNNSNKLIGGIVLSCLTYSVNAATTVADGRGNAMGNTGVTTADYLLAPYYNPALGAIYRESDTFGILVPSLGANARDSDESLDTIDKLQDSIKSFEDTPTTENISQINSYLDQLADDKPLYVNAGVGISVAVPLEAVSLNFLSRGYVEVLVRTDIDDSTTNGDQTLTENRYKNSQVDLLAFGYAEYGVAFSKLFSIQNQKVAFGVTPKIQQLRTYKQVVTVESFDIDEYDKSEVNKTAFNFDLGAVWMLDHYRAGIAIKDVIAQKVDTFDGIGAYQLDPQVTVSGGYVAEFFTAAIDLDLTSQDRFTGYDDNTQFLRIGVEGNAWGWAQLRAGYEMDLEDTSDDVVTAGVGISPGDLVSLDLAGNYAGDGQFGVSTNLAFTF